MLLAPICVPRQVYFIPHHAPRSEFAGTPVTLVDPVTLRSEPAGPRVVHTFHITLEEYTQAGSTVVQKKTFVSVSPQTFSEFLAG